MSARPASGPTDILTEIAAFQTGHGAKCTVGPFIATLPDADRAGIEQAIDAGYTMTAIAKFVISRGFTYAPQTVVRHLSARCTCPRP